MNKITVNKYEEMVKAQNDLDDCIKAISVLDNAIECKFLFDKHSLECQKWIKEYKLKIEELREFMENARTNG